jgi:hypothetical protein
MVRRPDEGLVGGERVLNTLLSRESAVDHAGMGRVGNVGPRKMRPGRMKVFQYGIGIPTAISAPNAGLE